MISEKRDQLIKILDSYFIKNWFNKKKTESLYSNMEKKHGIDLGTFYSVFQKPGNVSQLSDEYLFWFADALQDNLSIQISDYFSNKENKMYNTSRMKINADEQRLPIEFENVIQVNTDQYITIIPCDLLFDMYKKKVILYNPDTQRNPSYKLINGERNPIINLNRKSVNAIKDLLKRGLFIPNTLTLNIRDDVCEHPHDFYNNTLVIKEHGLDIIDGYHRYIAVVESLVEKININLNFILHLTVFDPKKARRFIAQEDKRNKINITYSKTLDDTRYGSGIVNALMNDTSFYLRERIKVFDLNNNIALSAGKMIENIEKSFKIQSPLEANKIKIYISNSINRLIESNDELNDNLSDVGMRIAICCLGIYYEQYKSDAVTIDYIVQRILYYLEYYSDDTKYDLHKLKLRKMILENECLNQS